MDSPKHQHPFARLRKVCGKALQRGAAFAFVPAFPLGDTMAAVDPILSAAIAALAIFAGVSIGLLYRKMHEQEQSLRYRAVNAEAELRALSTMTDDAVLLLDAQGKVRAANPASDELFGRDSADFMGEALSTILAEHPDLSTLTQQGPASFHSKIQRSDGSTVSVEVLVSQVQLQRGTSYLALLHEMVIRELKPLPNHAASAPQDLSAPVSKFCHELNNHLTGVLGNISLILMAGQTDPVTQERALNAKKTALRAQEVSRKLHALAHGQDPVEVRPIETPAAPAIVKMPPSRVSEPAPRILVLDDEEAICSLLSAVLTPLGCDVVETNTSTAARAACEESVRSGKRFALVISDLSLAEKLTGIEAVALLKKIDPQLRAIITTGHNAEPVLLRYSEHGFVGALSKPYEIAKIERLVFQILAQPSEQLKTA